MNERKRIWRYTLENKIFWNNESVDKPEYELLLEAPYQFNNPNSWEEIKNNNGYAFYNNPNVEGVSFVLNVDVDDINQYRYIAISQVNPANYFNSYNNCEFYYLVDSTTNVNQSTNVIEVNYVLDNWLSFQLNFHKYLKSTNALFEFNRRLCNRFVNTSTDGINSYWGLDFNLQYYLNNNVKKLNPSLAKRQNIPQLSAINSNTPPTSKIYIHDFNKYDQAPAIVEIENQYGPQVDPFRWEGGYYVYVVGSFQGQKINDSFTGDVYDEGQWNCVVPVFSLATVEQFEQDHSGLTIQYPWYNSGNSSWKKNTLENALACFPNTGLQGIFISSISPWSTIWRSYNVEQAKKGYGNNCKPDEGYMFGIIGDKVLWGMSKKIGGNIIDSFGEKINTPLQSFIKKINTDFRTLPNTIENEPILYSKNYYKEYLQSVNRQLEIPREYYSSDPKTCNLEFSVSFQKGCLISIIREKISRWCPLDISQAQCVLNEGNYLPAQSDAWTNYINTNEAEYNKSMTSSLVATISSIVTTIVGLGLLFTGVGSGAGAALLTASGVGGIAGSSVNRAALGEKQDVLKEAATSNITDDFLNGITLASLNNVARYNENPINGTGPNLSNLVITNISLTDQEKSEIWYLVNTTGYIAPISDEYSIYDNRQVFNVLNITSNNVINELQIANISLNGRFNLKMYFENFFNLINNGIRLWKQPFSLQQSTIEDNVENEY